MKRRCFVCVFYRLSLWLLAGSPSAARRAEVGGTGGPGIIGGMRGCWRRCADDLFGRAGLVGGRPHRHALRHAAWRCRCSRRWARSSCRRSVPMPQAPWRSGQDRPPRRSRHVPFCTFLDRRCLGEWHQPGTLMHDGEDDVIAYLALPTRTAQTRCREDQTPGRRPRHSPTEASIIRLIVPCFSNPMAHGSSSTAVWASSSWQRCLARHRSTKHSKFHTPPPDPWPPQILQQFSPR